LETFSGRVIQNSLKFKLVNMLFSVSYRYPRSVWM